MATEAMQIAGAVLIVAIILLVAFYIIQALAWQTIARRQKHKHPWLAWIPFANMAMIFQLGGFHWAWIFLVLLGGIPILGNLSSLAILVLAVISQWRIFERENYSGWLAILTLIPLVGLIVIGCIAWSKPRKAAQPKRKPAKKK